MAGLPFRTSPVNAGYLKSTIEVGEVTTLDPGEPATVVNSGTPTAVVLDFGIPQGEPGEGA